MERGWWVEGRGPGWVGDFDFRTLLQNKPQVSTAAHLVVPKGPRKGQAWFELIRWLQAVRGSQAIKSVPTRTLFKARQQGSLKRTQACISSMGSHMAAALYVGPQKLKAWHQRVTRKSPTKKSRRSTNEKQVLVVCCVVISWMFTCVEWGYNYSC